MQAVTDHLEHDKRTKKESQVTGGVSAERIRRSDVEQLTHATIVARYQAAARAGRKC